MTSFAIQTHGLGVGPRTVHHQYDGWRDAKKTGPVYSSTPRVHDQLSLRPGTALPARLATVRRAGMRMAALDSPCRFSPSPVAAAAAAGIA